MIELRGLTTLTDYYFYNFTLLIFFFWFIYKHQKSSLHLLIITLFWSGMFSDLGKDILNIQKIITLIWSFILFTKTYTPKKSTNKLTFFILAFCSYFLIDTFAFHNDSITLVLAQLSKYLIPFFIYFAMLSEIKVKGRLIFLNKLIYQIILAQIILSLIKYFIIFNGHWFEGWVGSISGNSGGAYGTSFPLLALIWYTLNTNLIFKKKKDLLFIVGLLFIGFATGKRAIWFLFPILFGILSLFIAQKKISKQYLYYLLLIPLIFYFGVRLSSSLNPDKKIWGRFDPNYTWNYLIDYSTGKKTDNGKRQQGDGRVGAVQLVWTNITDGNLSKEALFGYGAEYILHFDHNNYHNRDYLQGIDHKGSVTGILSMYFAVGLIGVLLILSVLFFYPKNIKFLKLRFILLGLQYFLYIFYAGTVISTPALMVLYIYLIILSNIQYNKTGDFYNQLDSH